MNKNGKGFNVRVVLHKNPTEDRYILSREYLPIRDITVSPESGVTVIEDVEGNKFDSKNLPTDVYDKYIGFALAEMYHVFGSKRKFHKYVDSLHENPLHNLDLHYTWEE